MLRLNSTFALLLLAAPIFGACQPIQAPTPSAQAYAHPETLASTEWLAVHLTDPSVRILDGREPPNEGELSSQEDYEAAHIPGAVYVDVWLDISDPNGAVPGLILPKAEFEALMARLGIGNDTTVVVYDDVGGAWMARMWWALRYYGHDDVKVLNGGLKKWTQEGRPLQEGTITPEPTSFTAQERPELLVGLEEVKQAIVDPNVVLIDALPAEIYSGLYSLPGLRAGHIPTALNLPAPANFDPIDDTLLPAGELARLWQKVDLKSTQRAITYCGAGYYGALDLFALHQLGHDDLGLYDASWMEWGANPDLPVETEQTKEAAMDVMGQFFEAYRTYDVDKLLALHTDDAVWTWIDPGKNFPDFGPEGKWVGAGKEEIRAMFDYDRGQAGFSGYLLWSEVQGDTVTATELWESDWTHEIDSPLITQSTYTLRDGKIADWVWTVSPESSWRVMNTVSVPATNKEIVRRINTEIWNGGNLDLIDELYAEDYVRHQAGYPAELPGRDGLRQFLTTLRQAFPDFECTIANLVATDDMVVHYGQVCRGVHQGEWMGMPPSGKEMEFTVMAAQRLVDGKVAEDWIEYDSAAFMQGLGMELVPAQK